MAHPIHEVAIVVDRGRDNVAVAKALIPVGTAVVWGDEPITIRADIPAGHRFALCAIPKGEWVRQYGEPFARSLGLAAGDAITPETIRSEEIIADPSMLVLHGEALPPWEGKLPVYQGYRRNQGPAGVRNWVVVIPMSMCADHEAVRIATRADQDIATRAAYPNIDGVTVLSHDGGCACPDFPADPRQPSSLAGMLRIFHRHIQHPNVGAVLLVELGCEKTGLQVFRDYFGLEDLSEAYGKPVRTLTIQTDGGSQATVKRGLELMPELLAAANAVERSEVPLSELAVGVECGGSDGFSGLSANPALGAASDLWIRGGGSTVIAEVPEFFGAEHLFAQRAVNRQVARDILAMVGRYRAYAARGGHALGENPSPGNRAGGLINLTVKSLGAIAKGGSAPVQGVLEYGDRLWERNERGLYLLNTPGYDQTSVPGLVAAGCQVICFTTGRGSSIGNAIAPVVKIGSNQDLYRRMQADIDVNAGTIVDGNATREEVGQMIFDRVLAAANGVRTRAEESGHREFAIWDIEGIML